MFIAFCLFSESAKNQTEKLLDHNKGLDELQVILLLGHGVRPHKYHKTVFHSDISSLQFPIV